MNVLTEVAESKAFAEDVNAEIRRRKNQGWYLRGTPTYVGEGHVLLTFEKPEISKQNQVYDDE